MESDLDVDSSVNVCKSKNELNEFLTDVNVNSTITLLERETKTNTGVYCITIS